MALVGIPSSSVAEVTVKSKPQYIEMRKNWRSFLLHSKVFTIWFPYLLPSKFIPCFLRPGDDSTDTV